MYRTSRILLVGVAVLSSTVSALEQCPLLPHSVGATFPSGQIVIEQGHELEIFCTLNNSSYKSSQLYFKTSYPQKAVDAKYITVVNETTIRLRQVMPRLLKTYYICVVSDDRGNKGGSTVCLNRVLVTTKPQPVEDIYCRSMDWSVLVCGWSPPNSDLVTEYSVQYSSDNRSFVDCPKMSLLSCTWGENQGYKRLTEKIYLKLFSKNIIGNLEQYFVLDHYPTVEVATNIPVSFIVSQDSTEVRVECSWNWPAWSIHFPPGLQAKLEHSTLADSQSEEVKLVSSADQTPEQRRQPVRIKLEGMQNWNNVIYLLSVSFANSEPSQQRVAWYPPQFFRVLPKLLVVRPTPCHCYGNKSVSSTRDCQSPHIWAITTKPDPMGPLQMTLFWRGHPDSTYTIDVYNDEMVRSNLSQNVAWTGVQFDLLDDKNYYFKIYCSIRRDYLIAEFWAPTYKTLTRVPTSGPQSIGGAGSGYYSGPKIDTGSFRSYENEKQHRRTIQLFWRGARSPDHLSPYHEIRLFNKYAVRVHRNKTIPQECSTEIIHVKMGDDSVSYPLEVCGPMSPFLSKTVNDTRTQFDDLDSNKYYTYGIYAIDQFGKEYHKHAELTVAPTDMMPGEARSLGGLILGGGVHQVHWTKPKSSPIPIDSYTLFWCTNNHGKCKEFDWKRVEATPFLRLNLTLAEGKRYKFWVSANSEKFSSGMTASYCPVIHIRHVSTEKLIGKVTVTGLGANYLNLTWHRDCPQGDVTYWVYLCPVQSPRSTTCLEDEKPEVVDRNYVTDTDQVFFQVQNLKPFTTYKITMSLLLEGESNHTARNLPRWNTTLEDAPSAPPKDLRAVEVTNTSIRLVWSPPPQTSMNGLLQYYNIHLNLVPDPLVTDSDKPTKLLEGLKSNTNYTISVSACTVACSARSEPVHVTTRLGIPGPVENFNVEIIRGTKMAFSWNQTADAHYHQVLVRYPGNQSEDTLHNITEGRPHLELGRCLSPSYKVSARAVTVDEDIGQTHFGPWSPEVNQLCTDGETAVWGVIIGLVTLALIFCLPITFRWLYKSIESMIVVKIEMPASLRVTNGNTWRSLADSRLEDHVHEPNSHQQETPAGGELLVMDPLLSTEEIFARIWPTNGRLSMTEEDKRQGPEYLPMQTHLAHPPSTQLARGHEENGYVQHSPQAENILPIAQAKNGEYVKATAVKALVERVPDYVQKLLFWNTDGHSGAAQVLKNEESRTASASSAVDDRTNAIDDTLGARAVTMAEAQASVVLGPAKDGESTEAEENLQVSQVGCPSESNQVSIPERPGNDTKYVLMSQFFSKKDSEEAQVSGPEVLNNLAVGPAKKAESSTAPVSKTTVDRVANYIKKSRFWNRQNGSAPNEVSGPEAAGSLGMAMVMKGESTTASVDRAIGDTSANYVLQSQFQCTEDNFEAVEDLNPEATGCLKINPAMNEESASHYTNYMPKLQFWNTEDNSEAAHVSGPEAAKCLAIGPTKKAETATVPVGKAMDDPGTNYVLKSPFRSTEYNSEAAQISGPEAPDSLSTPRMKANSGAASTNYVPKSRFSNTEGDSQSADTPVFEAAKSPAVEPLKKAESVIASVPKTAADRSKSYIRKLGFWNASDNSRAEDVS